MREKWFYSVMFIYHLFVIWYRFQFPMISDEDRTFAGRWKFLTHWNAMLQILYYLLCGLLAHSPFLFEKWESHRDVAFHVVILPLSVFVSLMFWGLYNWDRDLVFPAHLDKVVTPFFNHQKHTAIVLWTFIEAAIVHHNTPNCFEGSLAAGLFCSVYLAVVLLVHTASGVWAYPVLGMLNWVGRAIFTGISIFVYVIFYWVGLILSDFLHELFYSDIKLE